jgi:hypothetical protein
MDEQLATVKVTAKKWAVENGKNVFIYKNESGDWTYMEESAARSIGIQPTGGILSFLQPIAS